MRFYLLISVLLLSVCMGEACKSHKQGVMSEKDFSKVYVELLLAYETNLYEKRNSPNFNQEDSLWAYKKALFAKYHCDSNQFNKSLEYYSQDDELMEKLQKSWLKELEKAQEPE